MPKNKRLTFKVKSAKRRLDASPSLSSTDSVLLAYDRALTTLRSRYTSEGILAGANHFADIWIRDCFYASWGSLAVGDYSVVKASLKTVLNYLSHDGQVPLRIGAKIFLLRYLGFKLPVQARYMEDKGFSVPTDGNSLFMLTANRYLKATGDIEFFEHNFDKLLKLINWNLTRDFDHDLLMEDSAYSTWADSLKKHGKVMYTNALHYGAIHAFSEICAICNRTNLAQHYSEVACRIKEQINLLMWNGEFYLDFLAPNSPAHIFSSSGNILASLLGLSSTDQDDQIQRSMQNFGINDGFCTITNSPKYTKNHIYPPFLLIGLEDYHNGLQWLWLGCLDAVFKYRAGFKKAAKEVLFGISRKILEYEGVYEVYHNGAPVNRLFYKSEEHFAWSSGLFVWACHELGFFA